MKYVMRIFNPLESIESIVSSDDEICKCFDDSVNDAFRYLDERFNHECILAYSSSNGDVIKASDESTEKESVTVVE